jgi:hypothetical protein
MPFSQVFELYLVMKFNDLSWIKLLLINSEKFAWKPLVSLGQADCSLSCSGSRREMRVIAELLRSFTTRKQDSLSSKIPTHD